jgi:hypothetical protein
MSQCYENFPTSHCDDPFPTLKKKKIILQCIMCFPTSHYNEHFQTLDSDKHFPVSIISQSLIATNIFPTLHFDEHFPTSHCDEHFLMSQCDKHVTMSHCHKQFPVSHCAEHFATSVTSRSGTLRTLILQDTCSQVIWTLFDVIPFVYDYDVIDR